MDLEVDYDRIHDIGIDVFKQDEELSNLLKDMTKIISDLNKGWSGPDCENFQTIATNYIKGLDKEIEEIEFISKFLVEASGIYSENDKAWESNIKKIGEDIDEYD